MRIVEEVRDHPVFTGCIVVLGFAVFAQYCQIQGYKIAIDTVNAILRGQE